ncbi:MAG: GNAT family N-acetyltransferase [Kiritimatiellae bacterium]|nr:GNAT family N-acetyltransferase [Kiritimatiellia bacterium]
MQHTNDLGQPIGFPIANWTPPPIPPQVAMEGRYCRIEPMDVDRHVGDLFEADQLDVSGAGWTYLPAGPFAALRDMQEWMRAMLREPGRYFFALMDKRDGRASGMASYHRIDRAAGSLEVGFIRLSPRLQRSRAATEAMFLLMQNVFELGYRRYEWKCDAFNAPSRTAAQRLGFSYEGTFRQATIYKGRNRDTAWYAIVDADWPALREAFGRWLDPANFDEAGQQRLRLSDLTHPLIHCMG